ncbi:MAG: cell envelope integrity protein TolA [Syntrophobacterales bacterium]|nr:cell envelope integrity protein TolA [Syntrophobacterales bacterium]
MVEGFDRGCAIGGLKGTLVLSLLLHAALFALLVLSPSFPSPKLTFGPVYNVSLVEAPGGFTASGNASSSGGDARAVEKEFKGVKRVETTVKRSSAALPAVPISRIENRGRDERAVEKAIENIRKKTAASGEPQRSPEQAGASNRTASAGTSGLAEKAKGAVEAGSGVAASSGGAAGGDAGGDARVNAYYRVIWLRIKGQWALPVGMIPKTALESVISITILRTGAVTEVRFEKPSGNRYFDESAMKAIQKASPLPPLPDWLTGNNLNIGIRFHSSELMN